MKPKNNSCREFLKKSSAIAAGTLILPSFVPSSVFG